MMQRFVSFSGRTAVVTGSGRNIGRAIALALAEGGASVVVNGHRDRDAVDAVVAQIRGAGGKALGVMADVSSHDEVSELVRRTVAEFGSVDIAISNVGVRRKQPFLDISPEDWHMVLDTNLSPAFYMARNVIPHMRKGKWGRIIHISGFDGFWGQVTERAHNITAKAGLHGLSKALAREFGPDGITAPIRSCPAPLTRCATGPSTRIRTRSAFAARSPAARPHRRSGRCLRVPVRRDRRLCLRPGDSREWRSLHVLAAACP